MSDSKEVGLAHIWRDRNVGCEVEVNGQRHEFVEVEKVGVCNHWHMKDECELVLGGVVEV